MIDERERFGRVIQGFAPPDDAFERLVTRKGRKQRNQRVAAGAVGVLVAVAVGFVLVRSLTSNHLPANPPVEPTPAPAGVPGSFAYALDGVVYLADPDGSNAMAIVAPDGGCLGFVGFEGPSWSPDGRYLAFDRICMNAARTAAVGADVVIAYPDGTVVAEFPASGFSWSPDSTRLAVWGDRQQTLDVYGVDGERQSSLPTPITGKPAESIPAWSPDGSALLVYAAKPAALIAVPLDGSPTYELPYGQPPVASPDGTRIVAFEDDATVITDPDGAELSRVNKPLRGAVWSPDGDRFASVSSKGELVLVDAASGDVTVLTEASARPEIEDVNGVGGFSPEGDRILYRAFVRGSGGAAYNSLYSVNVDGSDVRQLVDGAMHGEWRPS
jgi:Tol biopolymer transport system component